MANAPTFKLTKTTAVRVANPALRGQLVLVILVVHARTAVQRVVSPVLRFAVLRERFVPTILRQPAAQLEQRVAASCAALAGSVVSQLRRGQLVCLADLLLVRRGAMLLMGSVVCAGAWLAK